jgi:alanine-synthesizing transaminase
VLPSRRSRVDPRPNRLATALAERRALGRTHLDLTVSNPTTAGIPYDADAITRAISSPGALAYEPAPFGLPSARDAVAGLWRERGVPTDARRVALTASTSEAYGFLFKLLCDPGDAVLVPRPSYPLFEHLLRYEGLEMVSYPLSYDGEWHVDLTALRRAVTPRTRALVVVSPNNPTGSFLKEDELGRAAELGLPIVSDEVFGEYALAEDPRRVRSALGTDGPLVFALDGLSKLAALPQMKLAWITASGPDAEVETAFQSLELILDTFLSPGAPVQHALPSLLRLGKASRDAIRRRARANHKTLLRLTMGSAATPLHLEGGWYATLRLPALEAEEDFALGILRTCDTLVQPGFFYDFLDEPYVVLSLLTKEDDFAEGVRRLVDYVDAPRPGHAP